MDAPIANPAVMQVLSDLLEQQYVGSQMSHPVSPQIARVLFGVGGVS